MGWKIIQEDELEQKGAPASAPAAPPKDTSTGVLGETVRAIGGGLRDAAQGALHAPIDLAETALNASGAEAVRKKLDPEGRTFSDAAEGLRQRFTLTDVTKNQSTLGALARSIVRFGAGFVGAGGLKAGGVAASTVRGAVGDFVVSGPYEDRLSDFVQQFPLLQNPVTEFLATNPDDSRALGRFKAALEGIVPSALIGVITTGVKSIRAGRAGIVTDAAGEMDAALAKAARAENIIESQPPITPPSAGATKGELAVQAAQKKAAEKAAREAPLVKIDDSTRRAMASHLKTPHDLDNFTFENGVLNYAKMDSPVAVKQTLDDLASMAGEFLPHVAGTHRTLETTRQLADMIGGKPEALLAGIRSIAKNADMVDAYLVAGKTWAQSMARDISEIAVRIDLGVPRATDEAELLKRTAVLADLVENLSAAQTGAARATSAGRIRTGDFIDPAKVEKYLSGDGRQELKQLAERVRMATTPKGVIASIKPPTLAGKLIAAHNFVWINSILSGVKTHIVNNVSNLFQTTMLPAYRIAGGLIGRDMNQVKEGLYTYTAMRTQIFDAFEMAKRALVSDNNILDPTTHASEISLNRPLSAATWGVDESSLLGKGLNFLSTITGMPGRFLNAEDEFFKQLNYRSAVMAKAWVEVAERKIPADMAREYVDTAVSNAIGAAGQALDKNSLRYAQQGTFTQPLKSETWTGGRSISEKIADLAQDPILKGTVLPFIKVPANIMRSFADTGPLALMKKQFYADVTGGDPEAKALALGKLGVGSMMWVAGGMMAAEGMLTGSGPRDKDLQRELRATGWQPYSYVHTSENGKKTYIPLGKLDPVAMILGLAADAHQIMGKLSDSDADDLAVGMVVGLASNLSTKSYLRGAMDTMSILGGGANFTSAESFERFIRYRLGSYVPSAFGAVNPDDTLKEVRSIVEAYMARIPGYSESVEAKRDNFGKKFTTPAGFPHSNINPFAWSTSTDDPVRLEMGRLAQTHAEARFPLPPEKIGGVINLTEIRSTSGQTAYDRWLELQGEYRIGGKTLHESLSDLISSDVYKKYAAAMGEGSRTYRKAFAVDLINDRIGLYRDMTLKQVESEFPEVKQANRDLLLNNARSRFQGPGAVTPNPLIQR